MKLYLMHWTEYEAGWGSRPDGYTVFQSIEDAQTYIKEYIAEQNNYECFSRPEWTHIKAIEMHTPVDFGDRQAIWITEKDFNGEKWYSAGNKVENIPPKYDYLIYPHESVPVDV